MGPKCELLVGDAILQATNPSRRVGCCVQAGRFKRKLCWEQPGKRVVPIVKDRDVCNRAPALSLEGERAWCSATVLKRSNVGLIITNTY